MREFLKFNITEEEPAKVISPIQTVNSVAEAKLACQNKDRDTCPNGILIGSGVEQELPEHLQQELQVMFTDSVCPVAQFYKSLYHLNDHFGGQVYRRGEFVLIQVGEELALVQIRHFFKGFSITGQTKQLLEGDIFEQVGVHQKSKAEAILPTSRTMATPSSNIVRKVIVSPDFSSDSEVLLLIDFDNPTPSTSCVIVPCHPEIGNMVLIQGDSDEPWRGLVISTTPTDLRVRFFKEIGNTNMWEPESRRVDSVSMESILGVVEGDIVEGDIVDQSSLLWTT